jgi:hypothetical protein
MYKYLKPYKDLTNHKLLGEIQTFESINFNRYIIFNFESNKHLMQYNYSPLTQKAFLYNLFLKEKFPIKLKNVDESNLHLSKRRVEQMRYLNTLLPIKQVNSKLFFDIDIWNMYINLTFIKKTFFLLEKFFSKPDDTFYKNFLLILKKFFINFSIRKQIYNYNSLSFFTFIDYYKKFYKIKCKIFMLHTVFLFNFIKKTKNKNYLKFILIIPFQIINYSKKKVGIKKFYANIFFFKQSLVKLSHKFFISYFFKKFEKNRKISSFFKYQKIFRFWKRLNTLYFKLKINQLKFKYSKKNKQWKISLII